MSGRVVHGGVTADELADAAARGIELIDLSASLNPYGPHPAVLAAARDAVVSRYPEADARIVRAAYAARCGLAPERVLAGNGSSELIYLVARALGRGGRCLIAGPTFGEYAAAATAAGMELIDTLWFAPGRRVAIGALERQVREFEPALVFLCNPNNPTAALTPAADIEGLTAAALRGGGRLVVDEAYMDFAWPENESVPPAPGRLVLRSLTKLHAIPGLRAGFLLGEADDIAAVAAQQPPWSLSGPAAAAVLRALGEAAFERESRHAVAATRSRLCDALITAGFDVAPSLANFVLVRVGDAAATRSRMLARGFVVRDCTSFGLPGRVRIAIPHAHHLEPLLAAMKEEPCPPALS